jgi:ABC-type multidrug transport system permease subunit
LAAFSATVSAVSTKELRGRMRGRRAFVVLTVAVLVLSLVAFGADVLLTDRAEPGARWMRRWGLESGASSGLVTSALSARIGQAIYLGFLGVLTLCTLLAPALASGAVSSERERQTLELLVTQPISTLGMVVAKLVASLAYVLLLLVASIPLVSIVFAFGGVGPDDVLRAYLYLPAVAFGFGAVGLFMSALTGRTQVATVLSYIVVLVVIVGALGLHSYLLVASAPGERPEGQRRDPAIRRHAPEPLLWLNPLVANLDLACTAAPDALDGLVGRVVPGRTGCQYVALITGRPKADAVGLRDAFWPRSAAALSVTGVALTLITTQLVAPTRRLRIRRKR